MGYVSPALLRAMADHSYLDPAEVAAVLTVPVPPCPECGEVHTKGHPQGIKRTRWAPDCTPEMLQEIAAEKKRLNANNSQMLEWMWQMWVAWFTDDFELERTLETRLADAGAEE
jgi:hypothetical protein